MEEDTSKYGDIVSNEIILYRTLLRLPAVTKTHFCFVSQDPEFGFSGEDM